MASIEEKQERFKRVAGKRTNKIIDQIRLLGNCSNRSNYDYSDEDVKKIFGAIETELKNVKSMYRPASTQAKFEL